MMLKCPMIVLSVRTIAIWIAGFSLGRFSGKWDQDTALIEVSGLVKDLRLTRASLEDHSYCEADLRSEIRYSAGLSLALRGSLFIDVVLGVSIALTCHCLRGRVNRRDATDESVTPESQEQTVEEAASVEQSARSIQRGGPIRPSDLRQ